MDTKKFLAATIAGAVTMFFLGFAIYGNLLDAFMRANMSNVAVMKAEPDFAHLILAQVGWGAFLALVLGEWRGVTTFAAGASAGALLGAIMGVAFDFEMFATMNLMNFQGTCVDILVMAVRFGIAGGVVGQVIGMVAKR